MKKPGIVLRVIYWALAFTFAYCLSATNILNIRQRLMPMEVFIFITLMIVSISLVVLLNIDRLIRMGNDRISGVRRKIRWRTLAFILPALLINILMYNTSLPFADVSGFYDVRYGIMFLSMSWLWMALMKQFEQNGRQSTGRKTGLTEIAAVLFTAFVLVCFGVTEFRTYPRYLHGSIDKIEADEKLRDMHAADHASFTINDYPHMRMSRGDAADFLAHPKDYKAYYIHVTVYNDSGNYLYSVSPTIPRRYVNMWFDCWAYDEGVLNLLPGEFYDSGIVALVRVKGMSDAQIEAMLRDVTININYYAAREELPMEDLIVSYRYARISLWSVAGD